VDERKVGHTNKIFYNIFVFLFPHDLIFSTVLKDWSFSCLVSRCNGESIHTLTFCNQDIQFLQRVRFMNIGKYNNLQKLNTLSQTRKFHDLSILLTLQMIDARKRFDKWQLAHFMLVTNLSGYTISMQHCFERRKSE